MSTAWLWEEVQQNRIFGQIDMKATRNKLVFILVLLLPAVFNLYGQSGRPIQHSERVVLFTDRTLFISGEKILFSAFIQNGDLTDPADSSHILYCEIISPEGIKMAGNKYLITNSNAFGYITIPGDLITGVYYLRAYTKLMRNYGPLYYTYTSMKIINAERSEVQARTENSNIFTGTTVRIDSSVTAQSFVISSDKSQYKTRDTVLLSIGKIDSARSDIKGLSISVVPEYSISERELKLPEIGKLEKREFFYPESRGISITGNLTNNKTGKPLADSRINLSIIGKGRDFMAVQTDSAGRFYFPLPGYTGSRDLFLCTVNRNTSDPKILIDNDYCTIPVNIPSNIFSLTSQERKTAYNMALNVQLDTYFKDDSVPVAKKNQDEDKAFYGKPNEILYLDNYVQMPYLEDYFTELLTLAKVRMRQGKKYFKVLGPQTGLNSLDALTLVDLVAIDNPALLLAVSPMNISRIEVVNQLYVKGDQTYGGIINIISKRGDFAGIDLPSSGVFINYGFLAENNYFSENLIKSKHSPDTRNTIFWKPNLEFGKDNTLKISFATSDTPGTYKIVLNGINSKGEVFTQTSVIEIIK